MSLVKQYLKTRPVCKVTFSLPAEAVGKTRKVFLVGEFNNWSKDANPLRRQKEGSYAVMLNLETGREYQYRYLIDGVRWENDWNADRYVPSGLDEAENSVVVT
jgi:1,4-alpha-glucan branching enzyme